MAGEVILTAGLDRCLYISTPGKFEEMLTKLGDLDLERRASRDYLRFLQAMSSEETVDKQGRMNIPQALREYADLDKEVVITGAGIRAEIWSRSAWDAYRTRVESNLEEIAEQAKV